MEEGRREDIRSIWDAAAGRFFWVYKTAEDVKDGDITASLSVWKSQGGTWEELEGFLDMTSEDFDAAVLKYWNS